MSDQLNSVVRDSTESTAPVAATKTARKAKAVSTRMSIEHLTAAIWKALDSVAVKTAGSVTVFTDGDGRLVKKSTDTLMTKLFVALKSVELLDKSSATKAVEAYRKCLDAFGVDFLKRLESSSRYAAFKYQSASREDDWGSFIIPTPNIRKALIACKAVMDAPTPRDPREILARRAAVAKETDRAGKSKKQTRSLFD